MEDLFHRHKKDSLARSETCLRARVSIKASHPGLKKPTGTGPETAVTGQTGPNLKFEFEFKKMKNSQKIPKNTSSCGESNGVKFFQIFVHLVYFASI